MKNALIYSNELGKVIYSDNHPFRPSRYIGLLSLLRERDLISDSEIQLPQDEHGAALTLYHSPDYIQALDRADTGEFDFELLKYGLGTGECPVFVGVGRFARMTVGGTLKAATMAMEQPSAGVFNPAGGFHHALRSHAEGFCYLNDVATTAMALADQGHRVAVVDLDAHHGNGTQDAFYRDDRVLTISMHESGKYLYPWGGFETELGKGRGEGFNINIPLPPGIDSDAYLWTFNELVPPLLKRFKPDLVLMLMGGDVLAADPLTHLRCTNHIAEPTVKAVQALCPRVVMMGSGGYNDQATIKYWTLAWAALTGASLENEYAGLLGGVFLGEQTLQDGDLLDMKFYASGNEKKEIWAELTRVTDFLRDALGL